MKTRGRPKGSVKTKADWFKLSADEYDEDYILALEEHFGLEGYALYIKTLQHLCKRDNQQFENNGTRITRIARDLGATPETYKNFIDYCIKNFIFIENDGYIRSPYLDEALNKLYESREAKRNVMRDYMREKRKKEKEAKRKNNNIKEKTTATAEYNNNCLLHVNNDLLDSKQFEKSNKDGKIVVKENAAADADEPFFVKLKEKLINYGFKQRLDEFIQLFISRANEYDEVIPNEDLDILLQEIIDQFLDPLGSPKKRIKNLPGLIINAIKTDDYSIHIESAKNKAIERTEREKQEKYLRLSKEEKIKKAEEDQKKYKADTKKNHEITARELIQDIREKIDDDEILKARFESYEYEGGITNQNLWQFLKDDNRGFGKCKLCESFFKLYNLEFNIDEICKT